MITAAADGSALGNPGPAGWAWYVDEGCWAAGGWDHGTNNMGELMSVLDLLRQTAHLDDDLRVLCDSQYAINCISKWMPGWKRKGWRKADGKPVMNVELLKEIDALMAQFRQAGRTVSFEWVKGHAGHEMNEKADALARAAATAHRDGAAVAAGPGFVGADAAGSLEVQPGRVADEDLFTMAAPEPEVVEVAAGSVRAASASPGGDAAELVTELVELTRRLLDSQVRANPVQLEKLLHPEVVRHDSAGRVHTYRRMVQGLKPLELVPHIDVLGLDELAEGLVALRWRLTLGSKKQVVTSLWQRGREGWQLRLEQTTPVV